MFVFTINPGGTFIDLFDGIAGAFFMDVLHDLLGPLGQPGRVGLAAAPDRCGRLSSWTA